MGALLLWVIVVNVISSLLLSVPTIIIYPMKRMRISRIMYTRICMASVYIHVYCVFMDFSVQDNEFVVIIARSSPDLYLRKISV